VILTFAIQRKGAVLRHETLAMPIIKIGAHEKNHLRIDDPKVSRLHAVIETEDDKVSLIDLGTEEGTLVNGTRVNKCRVHEGDRIQLGGTTLVLESIRSTPAEDG
jgi:pSer/pThr/pTyr-binding forkhead associated (FHA) protein